MRNFLFAGLVVALVVVAIFTTTVISSPVAKAGSTTDVVANLQCTGPGPVYGSAVFTFTDITGPIGGPYYLWCDQDNRVDQYSGVFQDLEFTLPGITVNLAQHLLMATSPGRFLQFIYLDNFPATTAGPSLKIRQLIVGMLARIAYTKP